METKDTKGTFKLAVLSPEQVTEDWEAIEFAISESLPPDELALPTTLDAVYKGLMAGQYECLMFFKNDTPYTTLILRYQVNEFSVTKQLFIYSMYSYVPITNTDWFRIFTLLRDRAVANKCDKILAYSNVARVFEIVKSLGGNIDFRLIQLEV